jgi:hypothetical protein
MGSSWNTRREEHTVEELEATVKDAQAEVDDAQRRGAGRLIREAVNVLKFFERRLDIAREREERRKRDDAKDPRDLAREVVDRIMQ